MLKAGAIYFSILISFLVALLTGFLMVNIWLHHYHTMFLLQKQRLNRNINSALVLAREEANTKSPVQPYVLDLFSNEEDEVKITPKHWGGLMIFRADTKWGRISQSAIELCGTDIFIEEQVALYLSDNEKYLSLSGSTKLIGNCYIPKIGLRRANIEGKNYVGNELVYGETKISRRELPQIDPIFLEENKQYLFGTTFSNDSLVAISKLIQPDTISNSFYNKTALFYSPQWINLAEKKLIGNLKIVSSKGITIGRGAQIKDVIIYAPKIEIEQGFEGALQMFATDSIVVHENVTLLFPSIISIVDSKTPRPVIFFGENCKIKGDIVLHVSKVTGESQAECLLNEGCNVNGRIYCDGMLQLKGSVYGSVYCNEFIFKTPASIFENHLLDAIIDIKSLSKFYSGSSFLKFNRYKAIKWLN